MMSGIPDALLQLIQAPPLMKQARSLLVNAGVILRASGYYPTANELVELIDKLHLISHDLATIMEELQEQHDN